MHLELKLYYLKYRIICRYYRPSRPRVFADAAFARRRLKTPVLKGSNDGVLHSILLLPWALSIIQF
jgi:hypothetical protein